MTLEITRRMEKLDKKEIENCGIGLPIAHTFAGVMVAALSLSLSLALSLASSLSVLIVIVIRHFSFFILLLLCSAIAEQ